MERRKKYIDIFEAQIGVHHSKLVLLVKQCLNNIPEKRLNADELLTQLQEMKVEIEGAYSVNPVKLDLIRVRLAKKMKEKDQRIEELLQIKVGVFNLGLW